ncbi:beta-lactamase family protein [Spiractinospora alimapuensis]|uniref:serine hydrolase domain-containing protein n=1 Tax=Spiractinospora alimapuensis TaxID=2820884 RepID=UPI001F19875F|nr:beta-lactamase family protein [Spiractinospora alimapuensis]
MVAAGDLPGGVAVVGDAASHAFAAAGLVTPDLPHTAPDPHVRYDVASLTKVMVTWPLVGRAVAAGALDLDAPVGRYLTRYATTPGAAVTTRQILTHTARLDPVTGLHRYVGTTHDLVETILAAPLQEPGRRYIDRGYILLGLLLERLQGRGLRDQARDLWDEFGMRETTYGPVAAGPDTAPTERRLAGAGATWGTVHDESTALMGGVAGHAGVFTTAHDLARYCRALLGTWTDPGRPGGVVSQAYAQQSREAALWLSHEHAQCLGWLLTADGVVHHDGFTGASLAIHPDRGRFAGVLTNSVHFGRERRRLPDLRQAVRDAVL